MTDIDEHSYSPDVEKIKTYNTNNNDNTQSSSSCLSFQTPNLKKHISPLLLKHGLTISHNLKMIIPNLYWTADNLCLVPTSQELISYEVFDDYYKKTTIDVLSSSLSDSNSNSPIACEESRTPNNEEEKTQITREDNNNNIRLEYLEYYLLSKKVLFPTGSWKDCYRWKDNLYFTMWLRHEFLVAKYYNFEKMKHAMQSYPELTKESMKKAPPSDSILKKAFSLKNWNRKLDSIAAYARMKELANLYGGKVIHPLYGPILDDNLKVSNISLEDILDLLGYQVNDSNAFNIYCEEINMWPFWTMEYINTLATYLLDRCCSSMPNKKETIILEIGAGDGRLSHFVRNAFIPIAKERQIETEYIPKIIATDDGSWEINHVGPVEKLNAQQALAKYCTSNKQVIIICSWMPNGFDWTYLFRNYNVYEYILIGESDDGNCGHVWYTWGNPDYNYYYNYKYGAYDNDNVEAYTVMPPYQFDGYERVDLEYISELQYARFDTCKSRCSNTVSFRKM